MSNYLEKIIYLSEAQYQAEVTNNRINNNYLYVTDYDGVSINDLDQVIIDVPHGGTGLNTIPSGKLLVGNGTSAISTKTIATTVTNDANTIPSTSAIYNYAIPLSGGVNTNYFTMSSNQISVSTTNIGNMLALLSEGSATAEANTWIVTSHVNPSTAGYYKRKASNVVNATLVKAALDTVSTTAKKFLKDTGSWVQVDWGDLTNVPSSFTPSTHTHSYAGSSSAGGAATSANALNFVHTNEILMGNTNAQTGIHINHRRVSGGATSGNTAITDYYFKNGNAAVTGVTIHAANFDGIADKATKDANGDTIASTYAKLSSATFTGAVTLAADPTSNLQAATKQYVDNSFKNNDAMEYKGVVNSNNDLPATHTHGWTYKVATAGTYAGIVCEIGDMIICNTDGTSANNAHWNVIQTNIDGAVIGPASATANQIATFSSNTGKVITNSGVSIDSNNNITTNGTYYFGGNTSNNGKAVLAFSSTYTKYGIWYKDAANDVMSFSASGNSDSGTSADFAIEGGGKLYNKGKIIPFTDSDGSVGGTTTPVYVDAGEIKALSYTIAKSVPSDAKFTDHEYDGEKGITLSSGKFGHSNTAITAQTTQAVYPIKIDAYGHITAYGSAQTILSIGTGANDAAAGNHTHSTYVSKSGDTMTGALSIKASGSDANDSWLNFTDESSTVYGIGIRRPFATYGLQFKSGSNYYPIGYFSSAPSDGKIVIADGTKGKIKTSSYTIAKSVPSDAVFTDTTSFTITANATDGLWDLTGTNGTNAVTYALGAYSAKQTNASFYTAATNPTLTTRLNYDGYFYATKLYSGGTEVLTSHNNLVTQTSKTNNVKYSLLACADSSPTSGSAYGTIYDTKVYINPSLNSVNAGRFTIHNKAATPAEKVYMEWNDTDQSLDFIFA